ncbi:MAG: PAC2 family protein [Actinomycetota bacterium]|nr:PAC2 family protein [Actinomycetota bacterium]
MDNRYIRVEWWPELDRPVLIAGFSGWNDAAEAASVSIATLGESWGTQRFGGFDADEFIDYQATRPEVKLVDGVTRVIEWPENMLSASSRAPEATGGRGVVLLSGPEPNFRWRSFCDAVVELARELNVEMVVTMGALLADVPHSRPVSVSASAQDPALVEKLGLSPSRYEGPTGITGVLHRLCADAGIPSVSFWASVPHYLPAVPSAPAALALLDTLSNLLDVEVDTAQLARTAGEYREQVSAAVSQDSDLASYVRTLEERYDAHSPGDARDLPSGDELARELESFLRDERRDEE